jgi:hypothetical protein
MPDFVIGSRFDVDFSMSCGVYLVYGVGWKGKCIRDDIGWGAIMGFRCDST